VVSAGDKDPRHSLRPTGAARAAAGCPMCPWRRNWAHQRDPSHHSVSVNWRRSDGLRGERAAASSATMAGPSHSLAGAGRLRPTATGVAVKPSGIVTVKCSMPGIRRCGRAVSREALHRARASSRAARSQVRIVHPRRVQRCARTSRARAMSSVCGPAGGGHRRPRLGRV